MAALSQVIVRLCVLVAGLGGIEWNFHHPVHVAHCATSKTAAVGACALQGLLSEIVQYLLPVVAAAALGLLVGLVVTLPLRLLRHI